jgi:hypothetical protein
MFTMKFDCLSKQLCWLHLYLAKAEACSRGKILKTTTTTSPSHRKREPPSQQYKSLEDTNNSEPQCLEERLATRAIKAPAVKSTMSVFYFDACVPSKAVPRPKTDISSKSLITVATIFPG